MGRTACTEPQCLYKGALHLYLTVELYLYSPYGPYDLYRASVPVQGCTLRLPYSRAIPLLPLWAVQPVQSLSACTTVHFTTAKRYSVFHFRTFFPRTIGTVDSSYFEAVHTLWISHVAMFVFPYIKRRIRKFHVDTPTRRVINGTTEAAERVAV
jgi:hypothetical protein